MISRRCSANKSRQSWQAMNVNKIEDATITRLIRPSYSGIISSMANRQFDLQLIPKFHGVATDLPVMECLEDLELTCELCKRDKVEQVLLLQLKGVAWEIYWQLLKEQWDNIKQIRHAFVKAYETDLFVVFDQFIMCCLHSGETVDNFMTDLQCLAFLVEEIPPKF